jgi:hypothetical protein
MQAKRSTEPGGSYRFRLLRVAATIVVFGLLFATSASADYEQVGNFAQSGEGEQLEFSTGAAINSSGAGGVPAGSIYMTTAERVLRYSPGVEGKTPEFEEAWGWGVADGKEEFERCGPALGTTCTSHGQGSFGGEDVGHFNAPHGVAVDQTTGYVYILNEPVKVTNVERLKNLVEVFSADGSHLITRFGEDAAKNETSDEAPEKIHSTRESGIAVDDLGTVYIADREFGGNGATRVMRFEPQSPGDYEDYVYAGRLSDINGWGALALDDAGDLYAGNYGGTIEEFAPGNPAAPICTYKAPTASLDAMTVIPETGEVFYYSKGKIYRLGACKEGVFQEVQEPIKVTPSGGDIEAMAFDPALAWSTLRPSGVLYAADNERHFTLEPPLHGSGDVFAPAEVLSPSVESESVADTGTSSTDLRAGIDPHGFTTRFTFQYLSSAAYEANESVDRFAGAAEAPIGGSTIGGGTVGQASAAISSLSPETEYRFRVIATSECEGAGRPLCVTPGAVATFRTFAATTPGLPDKRAYELVSPAEKHDGEVFPADPEVGSCLECKPPSGADPGPRYTMLSAPDGDAVVYEGYPFSTTEGAPIYNEYLSTRSESGWQTTALSPKLASAGGEGYLAFGAGLSEDLLEQGSPTLNPLAPAGYKDYYSQSTSAPDTFTPLLTAAPPHRSAEAFHLEYDGHSADFSREFFAANDALTEATSAGPEAPDPGAAGRELYEWTAGQLSLLNVLPGNAAVAAGATFASASPDAHAISEDGSRVFWSSGGHLYVRENGEATVEIDHSGEFLTASTDGSKVLLSEGCLYTVANEACEDLTRGEGGFEGIAGQSEDLSHVYFVDTAVLAHEKNDQGIEAQTGEDNLYAWHEGDIGFVTTLSSGVASSESTFRDNLDWDRASFLRTAESSPDGGWLAFLSVAPLTGYENVGPTCARNSPGQFIARAPCTEAFLYDSATGRLRCASCNPTGEAPLGPSTLRLIEQAPASLPQPRYLTDAGRLYFDSSDRLSPLDVNGRIEDVYQFEPQGIGSCERAAGCVSLISTGAGTVDANFLAMDETGANVFFTTRERLVLRDKDELIDLYDAREDGGIAADTETTRPECQGEACQPAAAPPNDSTPGSSTFEGAGNIAPPAVVSKPKAKPLTRAQKLAKALKACRGKSKKKRASCEKVARKRYGAPVKKVVRNRKGGK